MAKDAHNITAGIKNTAYPLDFSVICGIFPESVKLTLQNKTEIW